MDEMYKVKALEAAFGRWIHYDDENIYPFKKMKDHTEDFFEYSK